MVKTVSGKVASWPATGNVTTRPLPVQNLRQRTEAETGEVKFQWEPHPESRQDSYRVSVKSICSKASIMKPVHVSPRL